MGAAWRTGSGVELRKPQPHSLGAEIHSLSEADGKQVNLIRFHYDQREDMFDSHSYAKGGCVLHMLRKYLGDETFFAGLNKYLNDNKIDEIIGNGFN